MIQILAALDFSEATPKVIQQAEFLAGGLNAHLWLVHVEAPNPDFVGYDVGPQSVRDNVAAKVHSDHQILQDLADNCRALGIETTALLLQGPSVETIVQKAKEVKAKIIVIGSHGKSGLRKLLLGSVSDGVMREAHCPVLVVRGYRD
jgi:nucleotide-binding universal stress UspA family protein